MIPDFLENIFNRITGKIRGAKGRAADFVRGNVRRAREFLGRKWKITTQNARALKGLITGNVILRIHELDDITFRNLKAREAKIISRINSQTRPQGWEVRQQTIQGRPVSLFRNRREIRFSLVRRGSISIIKILAIIGALFALYGVAGLVIRVFGAAGNMIFGAEAPPVSPEDINDMFQGLSPEERARIIEEMIDGEIPPFAPAPPGFLEGVEGVLRAVIIVGLVGFGMYAIVRLGVLEKGREQIKKIK